MANVRTLSGLNDSGFDPDRNLLVLSVNHTSTLYLVEGASDGPAVELDDPTVARIGERDETAAHRRDRRFTEWERTQDIHKLTIRGLRAGNTTLHAKLADGRDWIAPIDVRVVDNADYRQAGDRASITPELRSELQSLDLRSAVLRVAEDQMFSRIGRTANGGYGRYGIPKDWQWCGAFAYWCWATAADAKGVANPFGPRNNVLLSPQKAISWALQTGGATIIRYQGGDPYGNSFTTGRPLSRSELRTQTFIDIDESNPVQPADIVLVRNDGGWKHVALVWEEAKKGDANLESIDGNQGYPSIQRRTRDLKKKIHHGRDYALVFLHVDV